MFIHLSLSFPQLCKSRFDWAKMRSLHSQNKHSNRHFIHIPYYFFCHSCAAFCMMLVLFIDSGSSWATLQKHPHNIPDDLNHKVLVPSRKCLTPTLNNNGYITKTSFLGKEIHKWQKSNWSEIGVSWGEWVFFHFHFVFHFFPSDYFGALNLRVVLKLNIR